MTGPPDPVAILGLGLIGGSLAHDLTGLGRRVVGVDRDPRTLDAALAAGTVAEAFGAADLEDALAAAELVVLAAPVRELPALVERVARVASAGAVITDVGSTKRSVVAAAEAAGIADRFVGAHPMAGDTRSGWPAARPGLFSGVPVWLCPARGATITAITRVEDLWRRVGAVPRSIDPAAHDRLLAWSSHLPQLVASALAGALDDADVPRHELGPGGRDTTRLSASDPAVWTDILVDNRDQVGAALDELLLSLTGIRNDLAAADAAHIGALLGKSRRWAAG